MRGPKRSNVSIRFSPPWEARPGLEGTPGRHRDRVRRYENINRIISVGFNFRVTVLVVPLAHHIRIRFAPDPATVKCHSGTEDILSGLSP